MVSPENAGYLWTALQASKAANDELGVEGILLPAQCVYLEAIAETYKPGRGVLPQILDRGVPRRFLNPNPI